MKFTLFNVSIEYKRPGWWIVRQYDNAPNTWGMIHTSFLSAIIYFIDCLYFITKIKIKELFVTNNE